MSTCNFEGFFSTLNLFMSSLDLLPTTERPSSDLLESHILTTPINDIDNVIHHKTLSSESKPFSFKPKGKKPSKKTQQLSTKDTHSKTNVSPVSRNFAWDNKQDEFLCKVAYIYSNDWKKVQKRFWRTFRHRFDIAYLREKFYEIKARSAEKKGRFNHSEDIRLVQLIDEIGTNWTEIAKKYADRSAIMVKNRYYYLKKNHKLDDLSFELKKTLKVGTEAVSCNNDSNSDFSPDFKNN